MQQRELNAYRQEIINATTRLLSRGIMQASQHGNMSLRLPGTDKFLLTSVGGLDDLKPETICLLDMEGNLIEGYISPVAREIVGMHSVVYQHREEVGSVLHTHSPAATAFAIANREIPVAYEAQVRFLGTIPVPVAGYGPRGSGRVGGKHRGHSEREPGYRRSAASQPRHSHLGRQPGNRGAGERDTRGVGDSDHGR